MSSSFELSPSIAALAPELATAAGRLDLALSPELQTRLLRYLDLLSRWNATYNLTAVRDPQAMLTQHLVDCLAAVPALRRELPVSGLRVLDVGAGGGLPGVVLALLHPQWQVECVDAVGKKAAFIRQAGAELALANLRGTHARVEQLRTRYDLITSRAFAALDLFVSLTQERLEAGGRWVAMKGKVPEDEMAALPSSIEVFHVEQLQVPGLEAERCLVWMRRRD